MLIGGILILVLGIWMLFTPFVDFIGAAIYISIAMLIAGIAEIATFCSAGKGNRSGWLLANGILSAVLGLWLVFGRGMLVMVTVLPYMFAFWFMFLSISRLFESFKEKENGYKFWLLSLLFGIFGTILGASLIFHPLLSALIAGYLVAFIIIIRGMNSITLFFALKSTEKIINEIAE